MSLFDGSPLAARSHPPVKVLSVLALATIFMVFSACSSSSPTPLPVDRLLGPEDFPSLAVTATVAETGATTGGEPAVQVELNGPGFRVLESIVVFETGDLALGVLAGIKQDMVTLGAASSQVAEFQDISGIDQTSTLRGESASTVFFVQDNVLVRLTVTGSDWRSRIIELAETAQAKAGLR